MKWGIDPSPHFSSLKPRKGYLQAHPPTPRVDRPNKHRSEVDKDGDGFIGHADLKTYFAFLGQPQTDEEVWAAIRRYSTKNYLDLKDFVTLMTTDIKVDEDGIRKMFNMFDTNGDGVVTQAEFEAGWEKLSAGDDRDEKEIQIELAYEMAGVKFGAPLRMREFRKIMTQKTPA